MITKSKDGVEITIEAQDIEMACGHLLKLKDYIVKEHGENELTKDIDVAVETMEAFWCEHFGEDVEDEA